MNTYRVQLFFKGAEADAILLRKCLAQIVYDEFELGSVFGVSVKLETAPEDIYDRVMALCMVELEDGLNAEQISKVIAALPADKEYMPIEFHESNSSAYGFVDAEYFGIHDYKADYFAEYIQSVMGDKRQESPDCTYMTPDGRQFYMGYFIG